MGVVARSVNRITAVEQQNNNSNRVSVYVDGEYRLGCSAKLIHQHNLKVGDVLDEQQISRLEDAEGLSQAKAAALRLLGYRARTVVDLTKRLQHKHKFAEHTIAEVVAWLIERGYLDDTRYARERLDYLLSTNKMGRVGLVAKLTSEGVHRALAQEMVDGTVSAEQEEQWARQLAVRRASRMQGKEWQKVKRSVHAYLRRRGFDGELIWAALEAIEPDDDLD